MRSRPMRSRAFLRTSLLALCVALVACATSQPMRKNTPGSMLFHVFDHYGPKAEGQIGQRQNGVLISNGQGPSPAYAQIAMQERGRLFIEPGEEIYEGQVVGIHSKDNDLTVNALRGKQLTNFRASGKDDDEGLIPAIKFSLEQALEFIDDDELVEITPKAIRLRKKFRSETDRKRASRAA